MAHRAHPDRPPDHVRDLLVAQPPAGRRLDGQHQRLARRHRRRVLLQHDRDLEQLGQGTLQRRRPVDPGLRIGPLQQPRLPRRGRRCHGRRHRHRAPDLHDTLGDRGRTALRGRRSDQTGQLRPLPADQRRGHRGRPGRHRGKAGQPGHQPAGLVRPQHRRQLHGRPVQPGRRPGQRHRRLRRPRHQRHSNRARPVEPPEPGQRHRQHPGNIGQPRLTTVPHHAEQCAEPACHAARAVGGRQQRVAGLGPVVQRRQARDQLPGPEQRQHGPGHQRHVGHRDRPRTVDQLPVHRHRCHQERPEIPAQQGVHLHDITGRDHLRSRSVHERADRRRPDRRLLGLLRRPEDRRHRRQRRTDVPEHRGGQDRHLPDDGGLCGR